MICFPFVNSINYIFRVFFVYSATPIETSIDPLIVDVIVQRPKNLTQPIYHFLDFLDFCTP
jgi:hypothetical protein